MSELNQEQQDPCRGANIRELVDDQENILNTAATPEESEPVNCNVAGAVIIQEADEVNLEAYCVGQGDEANIKFKNIADGHRQIDGPDVQGPATGEEISQIVGSGIKRIGDDSSNDLSSDQSGSRDHQKAMRARDVLERLNNLAPDGIFRLENGRSSLAGADIRGADLSQYEHEDGSRGYKIEVPKRGAKGETEIVPLGEWLARANKDEIEAIVPALVYQDVESEEFYATNFGKASGAAIRNLKNYSKPYDGSPIDIMKDFSGHQPLDPDEPIYDDKWSTSADAKLLSAREYHHKMAIQDKILLDASNPYLAEMDRYVKDKMADPSAVDKAMEQMIDGMLKPGKDYTIPEGVDENAYRESLLNRERENIRNKEFGNEAHKNSQLEKFFCASYISEWECRPETTDAVNKEFNKFTDPMEREESLKSDGTLKDIPLAELCGKCGGWIIPDMSIYNDARRNASGSAAKPEEKDANNKGANQEQGQQPPEQQPPAAP
jgi:hypothetical protein